jgi:hypothetical protein
VRLAVKVVPKSSRNRIAGWVGNELKICVTAPPERGKANAAVVEVLAEALGIPARRVRILEGAASPHKVMELEGVGDGEVRARLGRV